MVPDFACRAAHRRGDAVGSASRRRAISRQLAFRCRCSPVIGVSAAAICAISPRSVRPQIGACACRPHRAPADQIRQRRSVSHRHFQRSQSMHVIRFACHKRQLRRQPSSSANPFIVGRSLEPLFGRIHRSRCDGRRAATPLISSTTCSHLPDCGSAPRRMCPISSSCVESSLPAIPRSPITAG